MIEGLEKLEADYYTHRPALVHARQSDIAVVVDVDIDDSVLRQVTPAGRLRPTWTSPSSGVAMVCRRLLVSLHMGSKGITDQKVLSSRSLTTRIPCHRCPPVFEWNPPPHHLTGIHPRYPGCKAMGVIQPPPPISS